MSEKLLWNESCESGLQLLSERLRKFTRLKVDLRINDNHSTMVSLLERRPGSARLSLHRMFLQAPDEVLLAVAHYVKGTSTRKLNYHQVLRAYIQSQLPLQDYAHRLNPARLMTEGNYYDIGAICHELNEQYFKGALKLNCTWYGRSLRSTRPRQITYGQYVDALKLIKIHRMLDDSFFPPYFVRYVIYHEMVHAVVPGEMDASGIFRVHTARFKQKEQEFVDYKRALQWEKKHLDKIFRHGRP